MCYSSPKRLCKGFLVVPPNNSVSITKKGTEIAY